MSPFSLKRGITPLAQNVGEATSCALSSNPTPVRHARLGLCSLRSCALSSNPTPVRHARLGLRSLGSCALSSNPTPVRHARLALRSLRSCMHEKGESALRSLRSCMHDNRGMEETNIKCQRISSSHENECWHTSPMRMNMFQWHLFHENDNVSPSQ
jgi:hypothetical protein